jgi:subtilisin family serine protease
LTFLLVALVVPLGSGAVTARGGVSTLGGTSAAAAHVSGEVALMWQTRLTSSLPPEEARCIIRATTNRIGIAPIDAPAGLTVVPNADPAEKEGIVWAPGAVTRPRRRAVARSARRPRARREHGSALGHRR